jgi:hypothetical protein
VGNGSVNLISTVAEHDIGRVEFRDYWMCGMRRSCMIGLTECKGKCAMEVT